MDAGPLEEGRADGGWRARQPIPPAPSLDAPDPVDQAAGSEKVGAGVVPRGLAPDGRLDPRTMALALEGILPRERTFVQDGGHFIGWVPLMCSVPDARSHLFVGTAFQSIGLGFPSAVGAAVARPDRTTVLVTSSPALLGRCDQVVVLAGGRVRARGTHAELTVDADYAAAVLR